MNRLRASLVACGASCLVLACSEQPVAGNSSETENTASAREISVDSLYYGWLPYPFHATVATLRLDSSTLDFSKVDSAGSELTVESLEGRQLPFERIFWDRAASRGRLRVRLQGSLLQHGARFRLRWGSTVRGVPDSASVWDSISSFQRMLMTSVLVDDFEHGSLKSLLPDTATWKAVAGAGATASPLKLADAGRGRDGIALMLTYTAEAVSGKYAGINVKLSPRPISLRALDSIELMVRGTGRLSVTLDRPEGNTAPKTWARMNIDTTWKRIRVRPQDFDPADGVGGNIGWTRMRDSITHLTFLMEGGKELWIDDVRLHGIVLDDLR
ncbi:MAG TPA: hypothetical protein PKO15_17200 [Fibrobacteria bacterium]|nr:hypothetical protein [Fibrobacteria bacterium]HOX52121.1 hypothetical protein [Fibrobacteria bacterium]